LLGYAAGIAQYGTLLIRALARLERDEPLLALHGRRFRPTAAALPGLRWRRALTPPHHCLERWALPIELLRPPVPALLHSIDHVAPAWGPWRSVVTVHDLAFLRFPETHTLESRAYYAAAGRGARRAQRVIAVSRQTARDLVDLLGIESGKIRVVYEAAGAEYAPRPRADFLALAARLGFDPNRPSVLFVGTLEPRKNVPLLLEAFSRAPAARAAQLLLVGGRGWLDQPIFETHRRLSLGERARFLGPLPGNDLSVLYSHAAMVAVPSLYEGFGLVVLEAMACGAPVVSSNAGPLPEVASDAALLLPPDDVQGWADAVDRVLSVEPLRQDLRRRGLARAAQFSWERTARETLAVYREALAA
jgi:glycosyltransferase involved in cell wall biosynthesis